MPTPLSDLRPGESGTVVGLAGPGPSRRRLAEMGLVGGVRVTLVRVAPLGDPLELRVGAASLALRRATAREVLVDAP